MTESIEVTRPRGADSGPRHQDWATPAPLVRELAHRYAGCSGGVFDLDPCASESNAQAAKYFTEADDGLSREWFGSVFCNPPYKWIAHWVLKARQEHEAGRTSVIVLLLPARTDQAWFHDHVLGVAEVEFVRGRVAFVEPGSGLKLAANREASMVVVYRRPLAAAKEWR